MKAQFFVGCVMLAAIAMPRGGSAEYVASPEFLAQHFRELVVMLGTANPATPGTADPRLILRWERTNLSARFLGVANSKAVKGASIGSGLLMGAVSDAIEIETGPIAMLNHPKATEALAADLVFLVSDQSIGNAAIFYDFLPRLKSAELSWIEGPEALGPGCGAAIGYRATTGRIEKAFLTIDATAVFRAFNQPGNTRNQSGLLFDCVNRQLMAALGLTRDWGTKVSRTERSVFGPPQSGAPFDDMIVLELLYQPDFIEALESSEIDNIIESRLACVAETHQICADN